MIKHLKIQTDGVYVVESHVGWVDIGPVLDDFDLIATSKLIYL